MADIFENIIGIVDDGLLEERPVEGLNFEPHFHGDYKLFEAFRLPSDNHFNLILTVNQ